MSRLFLIFACLLISIQSIGQNKDSIALVKSITKLLKSSGYTGSLNISVKSEGQKKGGQTAFVIINNYGEKKLTNKQNLSVAIDSSEGPVPSLLICPVVDEWVQPFVIYPMLALPDTNYSVLFLKSLGATQGYDYKDSISMNNTWFRTKVQRFTQPACSKKEKISIPIWKKHAFFIFGEFAAKEQWYYYYDGSIYYFQDNSVLKKLF